MVQKGTEIACGITFLSENQKGREYSGTQVKMKMSYVFEKHITSIFRVKEW
jgi:hypothetical protein